MDTYEYPLGVQFKASTPEHAAARVFGGKPADYLATVYQGALYRYVQVTDASGSYIGDIPIVESE